LRPLEPANIFLKTAWAPEVAGTIIGLLQIPVRLLSKGGLGSSGASIVLAATVVNLKSSKR